VPEYNWWHQQQLDEANASTAALNAGESSGTSMDDINKWWTDVRDVFNTNPEAFTQWEGENPEMAMRWHARAANKDVANSQDWSNEDHTNRGRQLAQQTGFGGEDGKENGQMIAYEYGGPFKDVNNEWGAGDFWKIGRPNKIKGGIKDFLEDNPWKAVGMVAAAFVAPQLAGYLATAGAGMSPVAAAALSNAILTGVQGGDLEEVIKSGGLAGLSTYGLQKLNESGALGDLFKSPEYTLQGPDGAPILGADGNPITVFDPSKHGALPEGMDGTWVPDKTFSLPDIPDFVTDTIDGAIQTGEDIIENVFGDDELEGTGGDAQIGDNLPDPDINDMPPGATPPFIPIPGGGGGGGGNEGSEGGATNTDVTPIAQTIDPSHEYTFMEAPKVSVDPFPGWRYNPNGMMNT
jgi:hypothetical protein